MQGLFVIGLLWKSGLVFQLAGVSFGPGMHQATPSSGLLYMTVLYPRARKKANLFYRCRALAASS